MSEEELQCPVCGYYCLGKGGVGCIDKPAMLRKKEELDAALWNMAERQSLSASQAREAELLEKLEAGKQLLREQIRLTTERTEKLLAAEARIKASQEQEPAAFMETITGLVCLPNNEHRIKYANCYKPLYKQPPTPPELAELQRDNLRLVNSLELECAKNAELHKLIEERRKTAIEFDAPRIRTVANALGCEDALPADDETLIGCIGTVMGVFRRKIEESKLLSSSLPEGWQLVPIDPTPEMIAMADRVDLSQANVQGNYYNLWQLMISASPEQPKEPKQ